MKNKFTSLMVLGVWLSLICATSAPLAAATLPVTSTADSGAGTLRAALASAANGDTIDATGVSGTILLTSGELLVPNSVTILGPGPANLAVNGNAASRVFHVSGAVVTIAGLTITNGRAVSGGGIFTGPGALTVSNCTLSGNSCTSGHGGGIHNNGVLGSATLTVSTSTLSSNSAGVYGGGIYNDGVIGSATLTVSTSTLSGNSAQFGGGLFNDGNAGSASLTLSASTLSRNSASVSGGGIYNGGNSSGTGAVQIVTSTVSSNSAQYDGGGIYNSAMLTLSNSSLSGNSAGSLGGGLFNDGSFGSAKVTLSVSTLGNNWAIGHGGGIYNYGDTGTGTVQIVTSTLDGNRASGNGGGIYNDGQYSSNVTLTVSASTFNSNSATNSGGGIYNNGYNGSATLTLSTSTLSSNSATSSGGGIYNFGTSSGTGTVQIVTSTFSRNSALYGGGISNEGTSSGKATLLVRASTFSGNSAAAVTGGGGIDNYYNGVGGSASVELGSTILKAGAVGANIANLSGTISSDGYNLASDNGGGFLTGTADQLNTEPLLGPLQDNGGPTFTHALLPGSPAIDQGKNLTGSATDQRGFPRTIDGPCITNASGGDGTDIGAFEVQQPCPVAVSLGNVGVVSGQFGFDIAGGSNQVVVVEASTNLVNWTALATNTLSTGPLHFNDPGWTNLQQRFYRAKLVP